MARITATSLFSKVLANQFRHLPRPQESLGKTGLEDLCVTCGVDLMGRPAFPVQFGKSFSDWQYLIKSSAPAHQCADCNFLMSGAYLSQVQSRIPGMLVSQAGVFRFTTDADRAALFLNPPEPPFAVAIATTMGQHVWFRTPITLDRDLIQIAMGRDMLLIHRPLALDYSNRLMRWSEQYHAVPTEPELLLEETSRRKRPLQSARRPAKQGPVVYHPFHLLDRSLKDPMHGIIHPRYRLWFEQNDPDFLIELENLDAGTLFVLATLNKRQKTDYSADLPQWTPALIPG